MEEGFRYYDCKVKGLLYDEENVTLDCIYKDKENVKITFHKVGKISGLRRIDRRVIHNIRKVNRDGIKEYIVEFMDEGTTLNVECEFVSDTY